MTAPVAADTAAVVVAHDGARWLTDLFESIAAQSLLPSVVVVVDDASQDGTRGLARDLAAELPVPVDVIPTDGSGAPDLKTRVARNVALGLTAVREYDQIVVSDQDDLWLPNRVEDHLEAIRSMPGALLVAGDGRLVDGRGRPTGGSLRDRFPVPAGWSAASPGKRMEWALARPLVTGSAMAVTAELVRLAVPVPRGWLHDRWATLVAAARGGLVLSDALVIDYRVHAAQVVGDRQADVPGPQWLRALRRGATPVDLARRVRDVVGLRRLATDEDVREVLVLAEVVRRGLGRD